MTDLEGVEAYGDFSVLNVDIRGGVSIFALCVVPLARLTQELTTHLHLEYINNLKTGGYSFSILGSIVI